MILIPSLNDRLYELCVRFTQEPEQNGPVTTAVFDDTCGNLIQIAQRGSGSSPREKNPWPSVRREAFE